jgi:hypothetical protein
VARKQFDQDLLVIENDEGNAEAFFYSSSDLYGSHKAAHGVRPYNPDTDPIFVPSSMEQLTGSGIAVNVRISGSTGGDGGSTKSAQILVASRLLTTALGGGTDGLIGKSVRIGGTDITIESVNLVRKATFT